MIKERKASRSIPHGTHLQSFKIMHFVKSLKCFTKISSHGHWSSSGFEQAAIELENDILAGMLREHEIISGWNTMNLLLVLS